MVRAALRSSPNPRDHILDVAAAVFAEQGFAGARIDEIARRAGVNKAMLYYRVGNKEALYEAVVERVFDFAGGRIRSVLERTADPVGRVRAMTSEIAQLAAAQPHLPAILLREIASGGGNLSDAMLARVGALLGHVARVYREGAEAGVFRAVDPVVVHMVTVGSLMLLVGSRPMRARLEALGAPGARAEAAPRDLAAAFATLLLDGLRLHEEQSR